MTDLIAGHYRVVRELGRGAQGATYLAIDERRGEQVALKEIDFASVGSWETVNLFEREAALLGGLQHPGIPRIRESFRIDEGGALRLFLAQDFVPGDDLQKRLNAGALFDEKRLRAIAASVLEILTYLHGHSPPLLHRDVKPANLIARPDGTIALVDFGAAQGSGQETTVIGTTGYMPAEQLMGRAMPQSDLFALGATLIHLATRKHPSDLGEGLGLDWRRHANLSDHFAGWIDRMVAPMPEDRFPSAFAARRGLEELDARKRAREEVDDEADEFGAVMPWETRALASVPSPRGRYAIARRGARFDATWQRRRFNPRQRRAVWIAYLAVAGLGTVAQLGGVVLLATIALGVLALPRMGTPPHKQIIGHPLGLDLVRGSDEVVRRIKLDEIAGPDVEASEAGVSLILWHRDGSRTVIDHVILDRKDVHVLRSELHAWLMDARRQA